MKKLLSIVGTFSITASGASYLISSKSEVQKNNSNYEIKDELNWSETNQALISLFDNVKKSIVYNNENNSNFSKKINQSEIIKYIEFSQSKSQEILSKLSNQNLSLEQTIDYIKLNNERFENSYKDGFNQFKDMNQKKDYTNFLNQYEKTNSNIFGENINYIEKLSSYQKNSELVSKLKIAKVTIASLAAASAIAAAGFWAGAFWSFGSTIPWAIGCSTAAGILSATAGGLSIALVEYDNEMNNWSKFGSALTATIALGQVLASTARNILLPTLTCITPLCWCMPALIALCATIGAIVAWIDLVKF